MDNLKFVSEISAKTRRKKLAWEEPDKLLCWIDFKARHNCKEVYRVKADAYFLSVQQSLEDRSCSITISDWNMEEIYTISNENLFEQDSGRFLAPEERRESDYQLLLRLFTMAQEQSQEASSVLNVKW